MSEQEKRIKDLKKGELVTLETKEYPVHRVVKRPIFEGDVREVYVDDGSGLYPSAGLYDGEDLVLVHEARQ